MTSPKPISFLAQILAWLAQSSVRATVASFEISLSMLESIITDVHAKCRDVYLWLLQPIGKRRGCPLLRHPHFNSTTLRFYTRSSSSGKVAAQDLHLKQRLGELSGPYESLFSEPNELHIVEARLKHCRREDCDCNIWFGDSC